MSAPDDVKPLNRDELNAIAVTTYRDGARYVAELSVVDYDRLLATARRDVHNHGPEDGPGLACREIRLTDGRLIGSCLLAAAPLAPVRAPEKNEGASAGEPRSDAADAERMIRTALEEAEREVGNRHYRVALIGLVGALHRVLAQLRATARPQVVQSPPSVEGVPTREEMDALEITLERAIILSCKGKVTGYDVALVERDAALDALYSTLSEYEKGFNTRGESAAESCCQSIKAEYRETIDGLRASLAAAREDAAALRKAFLAGVMYNMPFGATQEKLEAEARRRYPDATTPPSDHAPNHLRTNA